MNKIKYFKDNVKKYAKLLKIKEPYLKQDNRLGKYYVCCVEIDIWKDNNEEFTLLRYNTNHIKESDKSNIIHLILHELGHIKFRHHYLKHTLTNTINSEYEAEKFALAMIKKYHPNYYKRALCRIENGIKQTKKTQYKIAFSKLLEEEYESENK